MGKGGGCQVHFFIYLVLNIRAGCLQEKREKVEAAKIIFAIYSVLNISADCLQGKQEKVEGAKLYIIHKIYITYPKSEPLKLQVGQIIHCLQEKREKVEAAKLPGERRAVPLEPAELANDLPTSAADVDAFNARMFDYYNNRSAAVPCLLTCSLPASALQPKV